MKKNKTKNQWQPQPGSECWHWLEEQVRQNSNDFELGSEIRNLVWSEQANQEPDFWRDWSERSYIIGSIVGIFAGIAIGWFLWA